MKLSRQQIIQTIEKTSRDAGFLVNVILCLHARPWTKLRGAAMLLLSGHDVHVGQFDMDALVVDGERTSWAALETAR